MFGFIRAFNRHTDIVSLFLIKLCELNSKLIEMQPGNLLVEGFGKSVNTDLIIIFPEINLSQGLITE